MYVPPASPNSLLLRSSDVRELLFFKASMKYWASLSQSWLPCKQRQIKGLKCWPEHCICKHKISVSLYWFLQLQFLITQNVFIALIGCNQVLMLQIVLVINLNVKYGVKPCRGKNYAYDVDQEGQLLYLHFNVQIRLGFVVKLQMRLA